MSISVEDTQYSQEQEMLIELVNQERPTLSVIIPTINEGGGIGLTLSELPLKKLERMGFSCEVIIVDGGSTDDTVQKAKQNRARVIHECRKGYGRAYRTGFGASMGDILVTLDGDSSYPAFLIPELVDTMLKENLDFITTNRLRKLEPESMSSTHRLGNWVLSMVVRLLFSARLNDSQSGMWVIKRSLLENIVPMSDDMPFSQEIKIRALRSFKCKEISVPYRKRNGNRKLRTFSHGFLNLLHLFLLRVILTTCE